jgi:hypothetical protein
VRFCLSKALKLAIPRIVVAALLVFALLSSVAPLSTFSSAHLCTMSCCIGKPPHLAGSCSVSFIHQKKTLDSNFDTDENSLEHHDGMHARANVREEESANSSDHCHTETHFAAETSSAQEREAQPAGIASQILTQPCPPECQAGASSFARVRPSRDPAAMAHACQPRPPTNSSLAGLFFTILLLPANKRRQSRPRAPPLFS